MSVIVTVCGPLTVLCGSVANVRLEGLAWALATSGVIVTDGALALVAGVVALVADGAT